MENFLGLTVSSDDELGDLEDLHDWLRQEPELRGHVRAVRQPPAPGHMGSVMELVIAAVAAGGVLPVLASSLEAWLSRPRKSGVDLKIRYPDGKTIEISAKRRADVKALLEQVKDDDAAAGS